MLKVWRELSWWWVLACLIVLAMEDIRDGWLSMPVIGILGITGIAGLLLLGRRTSLLPGLIILGSGFFSEEKIGYGDGYLMLALGTWLGILELLWILGIGLFMAVCISVVTHRKELPLVPFLTAAYILGRWC